MSIQFAVNGLRFEDIRNQVIEYLKSNSERAGNFDYKGSNLATMIDTMAYTTMLLSYQLANMANNSFLDSTNVRKNAISLAKNIGYKPRRPVSSKLTGSFKYFGQNFDSSTKITIKAFSPFLSSSGKKYINLEPIQLIYTGNSTFLEGDYILTEGTVKSYFLYGTGKPMQSFEIPMSNVEENYFNVFVYDSNQIISTPSDREPFRWKFANTFSNIVENQTIYFMEEDIINEGHPRIVFGNGIVGSSPGFADLSKIDINTVSIEIPKVSDIIEIEYLETSGAAGNGDYLAVIPDSSYFEVNDELSNRYNFTFSLSNIDTSYSSPTNLSFGGSDLETIDSIKNNAPRFFQRVGKLVTKNDYYSYLSEYSKINLQSVNVAGSDEFFLEPYTAETAGRIYITAIPDLPTNIASANRLYLTDLEEQQIISDLKNISILSTTRKFYKPSYIYLNVTPTVEIANSISIAEQSNIKNNIKTSLEKYFVDNLSKLGNIFRMSKLNSSIDGIPNIISSDLAVDYYFVINGNSFYSQTGDGQTNFIYLPLIGDTYNQTTGEISSYKNFVMTNIAIIDEMILQREDPPVDVQKLLAEAALTGDTSIIEYVNNLRLEYIQKMPIEDSTIYGLVFHPYITRYMYNTDVAESKTNSIKVRDEAIIGVKNFNFLDLNNNLILSSLQKVVDGNVPVGEQRYEVYFTQDGTNDEDYVITISYFKNNQKKMVFSNPHFDNLAKYGIIPDAEGEVFYQTYVEKDLTYYFYIKMIGNGSNSDIKLTSKDNLFSFNINQAENYQVKNLKDIPIVTGETNTIAVAVPLSENFFATLGTIDYEQSFAFERNDNLYLGDRYITSNTILNQALTQSASGTNSALYFIVKDPNNDKNMSFYSESLSADVKLKHNDVLFYNIWSPHTFKWTVKNKEYDIAATDLANLDVKYTLGDIFTISSSGNVAISGVNLVDGDIIFFNADNIDPWQQATIRTIGFTTMSASGKIAPEAIENDVKLVVNVPADLTAGTNFDDKTTTYFFENDLMMFVGGEWQYLMNIETDADISGNISASLSPPADLYTPSSFGCSAVGQCFRVSDAGDFVGYPYIIWPNGSSQEAYENDILIYVGAVSGTHYYKIFDETPDFMQSADEPDTLPIPINFGEILNVSGSGNFQGAVDDIFTGTPNQQILYLGNNVWNKVPVSGDVDYVTQAASAAIPAGADHGTIVGIIEEGDFGDNSVLISQRYKVMESNSMCYFGDQLIYLVSPEVTATPTGWYKLNEWTAFISDAPSAADFEGKTPRDIMNSYGFNSDLTVEYNPSTGYYDVVIHDIYNGSTIGNYNYTTGKMAFQNEISAMYNTAEYVPQNSETTKITALFNNYNDVVTFDKIRILPTWKVDSDGNELGEPETDFDTLFNQYILGNIEQVKDRYKQ